MKVSEHIEQIATTVADKATYGGAGTGVLGWITNNNLLGLIGVIVAICGFLLNWYYKAKEDKRRDAEHQAIMKGAQQ